MIYRDREFNTMDGDVAAAERSCWIVRLITEKVGQDSAVEVEAELAKRRRMFLEAPGFSDMHYMCTDPVEVGCDLAGAVHLAKVTRQGLSQR